MDRVLFKNGLFLVIFTIMFLGQTKGQNKVGTFTDSRDGEVYKTVRIGNQVWMAENMRYNISGSYLNPNNPSKEYERLYTWEQAKEACPSGWHLPSDEEWQELERSLGMSERDVNKVWYRGGIGEKLKFVSGWEENGNGSNSSGFNALPASSYWSGSFYSLGKSAGFWSSTERSSNDAWNRLLYYEHGEVFRGGYDKLHGFSCRCLKN